MQTTSDLNPETRDLGYKVLTREQKHILAAIRDIGTKLDEFCHIVNRDIEEAYHRSQEEVERSEAYRWLSLARTDFQKALMSLTRAVTRPEFF